MSQFVVQPTRPISFHSMYPGRKVIVNEMTGGTVVKTPEGTTIRRRGQEPVFIPAEIVAYPAPVDEAEPNEETLLLEPGQ